MVYVQIAAGTVWVNVFAVLAVSAVPAPAGPEHEWTTVTRLLEDARETEQRIAATESELQRERIAREALASHGARIRHVYQSNAPASRLLLYWKARLHLIARDNPAFRRLGAELGRERAVAPEVWVGMFETAEAPEAKRHHLIQLGRLLPVSRFGRLADGRESEGQVYALAGQPLIPTPTRESMQQIAVVCERVQSPPAVRDAWLEAIYAGYGLPLRRLYQQDRRTWLSAASSEAWLHVAALERQVDGPGHAFDYLAKAIVFGTEEHAAQGRKLMQAWRTQPVAPQTNTPRNVERGDVLLLAQLYRQVTVHPRAIALFVEFEHVVGKDQAQQLRRQYREEWLSIVEHSCFDRDIRCVRFGQPADTAEQRRKLVVPRILEAARLEEAVGTLGDVNDP